MLAWREALDAAAFDVPVWRIHRRVAMSGGGLLTPARDEVGVREE